LDKKDPKSENAYADQIDVRGIYADKLAAAHTLFARKVGNSVYDKVEGNYLDIPELKEEITGTLLSLLTDQVRENVVFTAVDGSKFTIANLKYSLFSTPDENREAAPKHWIETALNKKIADQMQLPMYTVSFQQMLLNIVSGTVNSGPSQLADQSFLNSISVLRTPRTTALSSDFKGQQIDIGALRFSATEGNELASQLIPTLSLTRVLDTVPRDQLVQYYNERIKSKKTESSETASAASEGRSTTSLNLSAEVTSTLNEIPLDALRAYLSNATPRTGVMSYLLHILPSIY
jgi:hypothetical protein